MSNSEATKASIPEIVELEYNTSTSTSNNRMYGEDFDTFSEESGRK